MLLNNKILQDILFYVLLISRTFCELSLKNVKQWSIISAILLCSSTCLRFSIVCGFTPKNIFVTLIIVFFYVIFFINTLCRISVSLGTFIDFQYPHLVLNFWESWQKHHENNTGFFKNFTSAQMPRPTPPSVPNLVKPEIFKRYGIVIAALSFPFVAYSAVELHYSRVAAERSADAAVRSAESAVRNADATEVQAGLMSRNSFFKKWPRNE